MNFSAILRWPLFKQDRKRVPAGQHGGGEFAKENFQQQLVDLGLDKHFDHRDWSMVMPHVSPKEFFGTYVGAEHVTKENMATIKSGEIDFHGIKFDFRNITVHGKKAEQLNRQIDFTLREAKHEMLKFDTAKSGGGIAKTMMRDCAKLYSKIGIDRIRLFAGLELGAYTWGKFGFRYADPVSAEAHLQQVFGNTKQELLKAKGKVKGSPEAAGELDMLNTIFDAKGKDGKASLDANQALSHLKTPHLDKAFAKLIAEDFPEKGTFVKWVMHSTAYDGVLELKDKKQMDIFHHYAGS